MPTNERPCRPPNSTISCTRTCATAVSIPASASSQPMANAEPGGMADNVRACERGRRGRGERQRSTATEDMSAGPCCQGNAPAPPGGRAALAAKSQAIVRRACAAAFMPAHLASDHLPLPTRPELSRPPALPHRTWRQLGCGRPRCSSRAAAARRATAPSPATGQLSFNGL